MGQQAEVIAGAGGGVSWDWAGWRGLVWTGQYKGVCGCQSWKQLLVNLGETNGVIKKEKNIKTFSKSLQQQLFFLLGK